MSYNLTTLTNGTTMLDIATYANNSTDGVLFGFFIMALFIIMILSLKRYDFVHSLFSSSFVCFIIAAIGTYGNLLNIIYPLLFLTITALSAFYIYVVQR